MKTKMRLFSAIVIAVLFVNSTTYSQELETIGAGVIDFLLTNPKTASKTNSTEVAALRVIESLLSISADREHEMNVAKAGRNEIVINTTSGNQATMYSDNQGNVYLLFNGTIYSISSGLVNQAKGASTNETIINNTLQNYNLSALKNEYMFKKSNKIQRIPLPDEEVTLEEFSKKHNTPIEKIYIQPTSFDLVFGWEIIPEIFYTKLTAPEDCGFYRSKKLKRVNRRNHILCVAIPKEGEKRDKTAYAVYLDLSRYQHEIVTTFTCNWVKDFNGQGLDFNDFQGIKRSFYEDEKMLYVIGYTTEFEGIWVLEIYESITGRTVYKKIGIMDKGPHVIAVEKEGEKLPSGIYIYNFNLVSENEKNISKSEKFEILGLEEK